MEYKENDFAQMKKKNSKGREKGRREHKVLSFIVRELSSVPDDTDTESYSGLYFSF